MRSDSVESKDKAQQSYELGLKAKKYFLYELAIKYLKEAAEMGSAAAMYCLGNIYEDEMFDLGHLYKENEGINRNELEALKWYKCAADKGYREAFIKISVMYLIGDDDIEYNEKEAKKFFNLVLKSYKREAEMGNGFAMKAIGDIYENYYFAENLATGVIERRNTQSPRWYKLALNVLKKLADNNTEALFQIADMYRFGKGVRENENETIKFLKKAAEIGNNDEKITAYKKIARIYEYNKRGEETIKWLIKAANLDDIEAIRELNYIYKMGKLVKQNLSEAERWLKKSDDVQAAFLATLP